MSDSHSQHIVTPISTYVTIFVALLVLTGLTYLVATQDFATTLNGHAVSAAASGVADAACNAIVVRPAAEFLTVHTCSYRPPEIATVLHRVTRDSHLRAFHQQCKNFGFCGRPGPQVPVAIDHLR